MTIKRVGIIGSGQLGRMMALDASHLNTEYVFFDEALVSPCSNLGPTIQPSNENAEADFLNSVDVITYESENTDAELVERLNKVKPVYPSAKSLLKSQHRLTEKSYFQSLGIQTANFRKVETKQDLDNAISELGLPVILKTTREGYDGKGQAFIKTSTDIDTAWGELQGKELIAEAFVTFSRELSVIAVRSPNNNINIYPLAENDHSQGILRVSRVPAQNVSIEKQTQANEFITKLLQDLDHVGVLTLELFDTIDGLVANEMAPRVHNSGHWSIEGAFCSQFENHIRAICEMPLGSTEMTQPTAGMVNIIGKHGDQEKVMSMKNAFYHAYGKTERLNRKIGHINIIGNSPDDLESTITSLQAFIDECAA